MKNTQNQPQYERKFGFYQQRAAQSPNNDYNYSKDSDQCNNGPIISKLEINFPQMKICESRKDINQQSLDFSMTSEFRAALFKQQNFTYTSKKLQSNNFNPFSEYKKQQNHRSPLRYNENSYSCQQTTKQDYDQNNTSYHDFFKVPQNLNLNQAEKSTKAFPGTYQQFDNVNQDLYEQQQNGYSTPNKNQRLNFLFQAETQTKNYQKFNFQPLYDSKEKYSKTQQKLKLKDNMSLSQLLSDLQHRSQKLYEMYGQNNDENEKLNGVNLQVYRNSFQNPITLNQKDQNHKQYFAQTIKVKTSNDYQRYQKIEQKSKEINVFNKKEDQFLNRNQFIQKIMPLTSKQCSNISKNKKKVSFQSTDLNQKYLTLEKKSQQKASTNFYFEDQRQKIRIRTKNSKLPAFINKLTRFFTLHLIKTLKAKFYYQTGVLSTQSNIQEPIKKIQTTKHVPLDKSHDRSKQQKQISFFQQYFNHQGKNQDYVIAYGVDNLSQQNLIKKKSREQKNYMQTNNLLPIEEQFQSQYGPSMRKSPQRIKSPIIYRQQSEKLSKVAKQKESKLQDFINTNQNIKMGQLLIESVNKQTFQYYLKPKNQKFLQKDHSLMQKGFDKVSLVMKYKLLTLLRHIFLTIKFYNPDESQKSAGVSSLRISSASLKQKFNLSINSELKNIEKQNKIQQKKEKTQNIQTDIFQNYYKKVQLSDNQQKSLLRPKALIALKTQYNLKSIQDDLRASKFNHAVTLKNPHLVQETQKYATTKDNQILQNEYYAIPYQQSQSKIQRNRLPRAVSCSKIKISQNGYSNEKNLKQSNPSIRQQQFQQISKIRNQNFQPQKFQDDNYAFSKINVPYKASSRILPGQNMKINGHPILPQGHKNLDMYNKTGKISRSYSENDFQHYYQHNINSNQQNLRQSNNFQQQKSKYYIPNEILLKGSKVVINSIDVPTQNIRRSSVSYSGASMNQNLKASNAGLSSSIMRNNQLRQSQTKQQEMQVSRNSVLRPNVPTVRPSINPSMQKKRCYSVGSFLNGPSLINGLNGLSNKSSTIKQLQAMPFIQQKNNMPLQYNNQLMNSQLKMFQNQHMVPQNQIFHQQSFQMNNYRQGIPGGMINVPLQTENRPRMSRSVDNVMIRPMSYSGFDRQNIMPPLQSTYMQQPIQSVHQGNNLNNFTYQVPNQSKPINYHISSNNQQQIKSNVYQMNNPIAMNAPIKQLQVDSQYHMLKASVVSPRNNQPNINNNVQMRKSNQNSGRTSRIMYEQQNLIINNPSINPKLSPQHQVPIAYNKPTSPRNVIYSAKSNESKQMIPPSMRASNNSVSPQLIYYGNRSNVGNQPQVMTQMPTANSGRIPQHYNHPYNPTQTNLRISKSKSPQLLMTKPKSPEIIPRSKPNLNSIKSQRLGSYGQY